MRFTEAVGNSRLRVSLSNLIEYTYNWDEFDPFCPQENIEKIEKLTKEIIDRQTIKRPLKRERRSSL